MEGFMEGVMEGLMEGVVARVFLTGGGGSLAVVPPARVGQR